MIRSVKSTCLGVLVAAFVAAQPLPTLAQDKTEPPIPMDKIEEVTKDLMKWFEWMLKSIPQYEAPEILENGDIIIRRKQPKDDKELPKNRNTDRT